MIIKCLEICFPLSKNANPEKYIELTDIINLDIVKNYNKYLPFKVNIDSEKTKNNKKKIKNQNEEQTSKNN